MELIPKKLKLTCLKCLCLLWFLALCGSGHAVDYSVVVYTNLFIPDGSPGGIFASVTFSNSVDAIEKVTVSLVLSSDHDTFNGDYYAFLNHNGKTVVLLNRVGSPENAGFGYADHGMDVLFDDDATNGDIHVYRKVLVRPETDMSQITGSWAPDGRTNNPSQVLDTDPRRTSLADFRGLNVDGAWILFIADLSQAGTSRLLSWGLNITPSANTNLTNAPVIASSPTNATAQVGDPVRMAVGANGSEPLTYCWRMNETDLADSARIVGTKTSLLSITNAQESDVGYYSVVVSNSYGSVTSQVAQLTVLLRPEIIQEPGDTNVNRGKEAEFSVSARGTEPLNYQWYFFETNKIAGATNNSFIISDSERNNAGGYSVVITNSAGSITSKVARLNLQFSLSSSNVSSGGTITRSPNKTDFLADSTVELTATPDPGFFFKGWIGDLSGSNNPASLLMDNDKIVGAQFGPLRTLSVAIAGQGSVSRNPDTNTFPEGQAVVLTAQPSNGWQFVEWAGGISGSQNPLSLVMTSDQEARAVFRQLYHVDVVVAGQGQVVLDPPQTNYLDGTTVTATAMAAAGYRFDGWSGGVAATNVTNTVIVTSNTVITAMFVPVLDELPRQVIDELSLLSCWVTGTNLPPATFVFSLDPGAPDGTALSTNGLFTWTPSERQGPSTNQITVRVVDRDTPSLSATNVLVVIVNEVNSLPQLMVPSDRIIEVLETLTVTNGATDSDWPANTLTFALVSAPLGVHLAADTGVLTWTPSALQQGSSNTIVVKVTDDGQPPLSATNEFRVVVKVAPAPAPNIVGVSRDSAGLVTLRWQSVAGRRYRVETCDRLAKTGWVTLREIQATDVLSEMTDSTIGLTERYYRIVLIPEAGS